MRYSSDERGYTMIETMLYIGILIVLGGVLAGYAHKAFARYQTGRAVQQVIDLKKAIVHFTAADEDYANVSVENMDKTHSLPLDMRTGDKQHAVHALGGEIKIGPASASPLNATGNDKNYMFFIQFEHLPHDSCVEILTQGQFYSDGSELDTLIVNGQQAWSFPHSFYNSDRYGNTGVSSKQEFSGGCTNSTNPDCLKNMSSRINISDALRACTKQSDNFIVWVFS